MGHRWRPRPVRRSRRAAAGRRHRDRAELPALALRLARAAPLPREPGLLALAHHLPTPQPAHGHGRHRGQAGHAQTPCAPQPPRRRTIPHPGPPLQPRPTKALDKLRGTRSTIWPAPRTAVVDGHSLLPLLGDGGRRLADRRRWSSTVAGRRRRPRRAGPTQRQPDQLRGVARRPPTRAHQRGEGVVRPRQRSRRPARRRYAQPARLAALHTAVQQLQMCDGPTRPPGPSPSDLGPCPWTVGLRRYRRQPMI
jgi:hypothetical protein